MTADIDTNETKEWIDALLAVIEQDGSERAHFLLEQLIDVARRNGGCFIPYKATTAYLNTISKAAEPVMPGDHSIESRIHAYIRWNAMAIVLRAGKKTSELGGHIASFASSATLYDVGFNHFFKAPSANHGGDLLYIQGHVSPGIYARSYLEGRISEEQLDNFRQEVEQDGLSSYPHPWLMSNYWQFATVSMGLGPIQAIYQARFLKYLHNRGLADTSNRKVWCFCGDGEMDEPESLGAISLAGREKLDNLIFVVNCNLQRLDGPVRGNGKIIQELEGVFRGAGWNVIKVIWGRYWDQLLAQDDKQLLMKRMEEALDGDYQNYKAHGGAYTREHFFGKYPELKAMVANMSDDDIWRLNRGGHDPSKVYAAYHEAVNHQDQPTVILAKTVKGFGMGIGSGEAENTTHQKKKMDLASIKLFRDRFNIPIPDSELSDIPFYKPDEDSPEIKYLKGCRERLGGYLPARRQESDVDLVIPDLTSFDFMLQGSDDREISTTMAFVRILAHLLKDKNLKQYIVPIIPDEARTFGMEGFFRQLGIYSSVGQLYQPVDSNQVMFYKEDKKGQLLEEGITEAGAFSSWLAAATSYSNSNIPVIPFYIFYSMFGFQRIADLAWAAGDMRARGFLLGATAGRTTLAGEGLQHCDGHSLMMSSMVPNCRSYDPTFGYELAVIMHHGLQEMYVNKKSIYYYITLMNENYLHPPASAANQNISKLADEIIKGMYLLRSSNINNKTKTHNKLRLLSSGTILREALAAAEIFEQEYNISTEVYSVTSFTELARDGMRVERQNKLNLAQNSELDYSYIEKVLVSSASGSGDDSPVIAVTDYIRAYADQIRPYLKNTKYIVLGTDGFGRSDTRVKLRRFFEVDSHNIVVTGLKALFDQGKLSRDIVANAMKKYNITADKIEPFSN
ncbi:MAG: pyruvate dehydrogenase (acetyl-transferring), homodimeric type [Gammaproteobacteria bacterium]|nr:pyruvate dehydrogenase (acetyl-transferring), homodimeric type [Gammaproteobacteria bacterium]